MRYIARFSGHTVARVRGDDPIAFLDAATTQDLTGLKPGIGALTCLLDEKGHVLSEFRVLPLASGDVLLDGESAAAEHILGWLARVAPLSGCEISDESAAWNAFAFRGEEPHGEHVVHEGSDEIVIGVTWGMPGVDILTSAPPPAESQPEEIERARIRAVRPRFGPDVSAELIVNETPLLQRAVSFSKGCYPGQETVAKIANLGRARRAVCGARGDAVRPGAVLDDGAGTITSALGTDAIATVRAEALQLGFASIEGARVELFAFEP